MPKRSILHNIALASRLLSLGSRDNNAILQESLKTPARPNTGGQAIVDLYLPQPQGATTMRDSNGNGSDERREAIKKEIKKLQDSNAALPLVTGELIEQLRRRRPDLARDVPDGTFAETVRAAASEVGFLEPSFLEAKRRRTVAEQLAEGNSLVKTDDAVLSLIHPDMPEARRRAVIREQLANAGTR